MLTPQQVDRYKRDGYLSPIPVLDSATAAAYRAQFDALEAKVGKETAQVGLIDYHFKKSSSGNWQLILRCSTP